MGGRLRIPVQQAECATTCMFPSHPLTPSCNAFCSVRMHLQPTQSSLWLAIIITRTQTHPATFCCTTHHLVYYESQSQVAQPTIRLPSFRLHQSAGHHSACNKIENCRAPQHAKHSGPTSPPPCALQLHKLTVTHHRQEAILNVRISDLHP